MAWQIPPARRLVSESDYIKGAVGVESRRGAVTGGHWPSLRFHSPLIEPDVQISRIRLSDRLHRKTHGCGRTACLARRLRTPSSPNTISRENRAVPRDGTL